MGGFDEAKKQFAGSGRCYAQADLQNPWMREVWMVRAAFVPESRISVQRDFDGNSMITDILPDDFYIEMAKALAIRE